MYEPPEQGAGFRVLVGRLWPRGLTTASAALDLWCRELAPSRELCKWYQHDPDRYAGFRDRYLTELDDPVHAGALNDLLTGAHARISLLTATRDLQLSHVRVLAEHLRDRYSTPVRAAGTAGPELDDVDAS